MDPSPLVTPKNVTNSWPKNESKQDVNLGLTFAEMCIFFSQNVSYHLSGQLDQNGANMTNALVETIYFQSSDITLWLRPPPLKSHFEIV